MILRLTQLQQLLRRRGVLAGAVILASGLTLSAQEQAPSKPAPDFETVYSLVKSNLVDLSENELQRAAVNGFLNELGSKAILSTGDQTGAGLSPGTVTRTNLFQGTFGFIRVGHAGIGIDERIREAIEGLQKAGEIKGWVLDLRFASGFSYPSAGRAAEFFFFGEGPALSWAADEQLTLAGSGLVQAPVVVLINSETAGAAEVLGALIRKTSTALLLGERTSGTARAFKDFPLNDGATLRIASGWVEANGQRVAEDGVTPDIAIEVNGEKERIYFDDPFASVPSRQFDFESATNVRVDEADLVRMRNEGLTLEDLEREESEKEAETTIVRDPALARSLDFLKGLALARERR